MLSSMFPEKMKIFNDTPRTPRLNSAIQHILVNNSKLQKEKSGQTLVFKGLSRLVEPAGVTSFTLGNKAAKEQTCRCTPWIFSCLLMYGNDRSLPWFPNCK